MQFYIIGFLATFSALWFIWPYAIIFMGPVVLPKKMQAEFIRKLKLDTHRYADAIRIARRFGWHSDDDGLSDCIERGERRRQEEP